MLESNFIHVTTLLIGVFASTTIAMSSSTTATNCTCTCQQPVLDSDACVIINDATTNAPCVKTLSNRERKVTRGERVVAGYRPHGNLARLLLDKQRADERLNSYDKTRVSIVFPNIQKPRHLLCLTKSPMPFFLRVCELLIVKVKSSETFYRIYFRNRQS